MIKLHRISWLFITLTCFSRLYAQNVLTHVGGLGSDHLKAVYQLSDSTFLIGGGSDNLDWLPTGTTVTTLNIQAGTFNSNSTATAFILHVDKRMQNVLRAYRLPAGTFADITRIRATSIPGQATGTIYISGNREAPNDQTGYFIGRLDNNFLNGAPTGLTWVFNADARSRNGGGQVFQYPTGPESSLKQIQPWDVDAYGRVVLAEGNDFSFDRTSMVALDANGRKRIMPFWPIHRTRTRKTLTLIPSYNYVNTNPDAGLEDSYIWIKYNGTGQKGNLRSYTQALYDTLLPDENGNPGRKGFYPSDAFFGSPEDLTPGSPYQNFGPGYLGQRLDFGGGAWTPRISEIEIDRRTGRIILGINYRTIGPNGIPDNEDIEPAVLAMDSLGRNVWWARLHQETPLGSPIQQQVDRIAIDYSQNLVVVAARCRGNVPFNFWRGNEIAANSGRNGFMNRLTGFITNSNTAADFSWVGKYNISDGRIRYATYVASYANNGRQVASGSNALYGDFGLPNAGENDLADTKIHKIHADPLTGNVIISATGVRPITTSNALQPMFARPGGPNGGQVENVSFISVYSADLSTLVYSTVIAGIWNNINGVGAANTSISEAIPIGNGIALVGNHTGGGNKIPIINRPSFGTDTLRGETGIAGLINFNSTIAPARLGAIRQSSNDTCSTTYTYTVDPDAGAASYQWQIQGSGWNGSSTTNTITLTRTTPANGGYLIVVAIGLGGSSLQQTYQLPTVTAPGPVVATRFPAYQCTNSTSTYTVEPVNGAKRYRWSLSGTGCSAYTLQTGVTTLPSVDVAVTNSTGICNLQVRAEACGGVGPVASFPLLASQGGPATPVFVPTSTTSCIGVDKLLQVRFDSTVTSYQWTLPSGINGASSTSAITITPNTLAGGTISVVAQGICGNSSRATFTLGTVINGTLPDAPAGIQLPNPSQCVSTAGVYRIDTIAGNTTEFVVGSVNWMITGQTNSYVALTSPANNSNTTLAVRVSNACGSSDFRTEIIRSGIPENPSPIQPSLVNCVGIPQLLKINKSFGATSYQWTLPPGFTGASDSSSILITPQAGNTGGDLVVSAVNSCGNSQNSRQQTISAPLAPLLAVTLRPNVSPVLQCGNSVGVFWVESSALNDNSIIGWSTPTGWTINDVSGRNPALDTIQLYSSQQAITGALRVTIASGNACGSSSILIQPREEVTAGTISGADVLCLSPGTQQYIISGGNATSYTFTLEPVTAGTITQSGDTLTVNFAPGFTGSATVKASTQACGFTVQATPFGVRVGSPPSAAFSGVDTAYCTPPAQITLVPTEPGGTFFLNGIPIGGNIINTPAPGTYTVKYKQSVGAGCADSTIQTFVVRNVPSPVFARVLDSVCANVTTYQIRGVAPAGGMFSGIGVSTTGLVTIPAGSGGQTIAITYTVEQGICTTSAIMQLFIQPGGTVTLGTLLDSVCVSQASFQLTNPGLPGGVFSSSNGAISVSSTGLVTFTAAGQTTITYTALGGLCGASATKVVRVDGLTQPVISGLVDTVCLNSPSIQLSASVAGVFSGSNMSSTGTFQPGTQGANAITFTSRQRACTATATASIFVKAAVQQTVTFPAEVCSNGAPVQLIALPAGGVFSGTLAVDPITGLLDPTQLIPGQSVSITYTIPGLLCASPTTQQINVTQAPTANAGSDLSTCSGVNTITLTDATPAGGTWSGQNVSPAGVVNVSGLAAGTRFELTYTATTGICTASDVKEVVIIESPQIIVSTPRFDIEEGASTQPFQVSATNNTGFTWSPPDRLSSASSLTPTANPTTTTRYVIEANFAGGCRDTASVLVVVTTLARDLRVNNGFTPNGDGANDSWQIENIDRYPGNTVKVFNRWGIEVYSASNYDNQWLGSGLPASTYYYVIDLNDGSKKLTGSLALIK